MPYELDLPRDLRQQGWKVKIREKERNEPPHITVFRKQEVWRLGLRDAQFLVPPGGTWSDIAPRVREIVEDSWRELCDEWDRKYPENPVRSAD